MKKKKQKQIQHCREALEKCKNELKKIEENPNFAFRPDIKAMRLRNCLLKIQELEGKIRRSTKPSAPIIQNKQRNKKAAETSCYTGMERPYSSGRGSGLTGRQTVSYTYANIWHPYSGGSCSPR
jgi:hypothetical protein